MANIDDFLKLHNVNTVGPEHHHVRHGWIGVDCPDCSPDWHRYRMGFELTTGRCRCWFCGAKNPVKMLSRLCGVNYTDAKVVLGNVDLYIPKIEDDLRGTLRLPKSVGPLQEAHCEYLRRRGFDPKEIAETWGVQGIGLSGDLKWRLFIPVYDQYHRMVSWTTRCIGNQTLRYISAKPEQEIVPIKSLLYGIHLARQTVIVVEGPLDAWAIGPGAVALCGIGYSQLQVEQIAKFPIRVICLDSADEAQNKARALCKHLAAVEGQTINIQLESGSDPADADADEIQTLRNEFLYNC